MRQATLGSWALPTGDAVILLDALEYDLDSAMLEDLATCEAKAARAPRVGTLGVRTDAPMVPGVGPVPHPFPTPVVGLNRGPVPLVPLGVTPPVVTLVAPGSGRAVGPSDREQRASV